MKKKDYLWFALLLLACVCLGFAVGKYNRPFSFNLKELKQGQNKVNETLDIIRQNYVDTVDISRLTESAVIKMVSELDPHSSYIPASDVESVNEDLDVSFGGIGIQFNITTDTILIISIISGGPAEKAGLMPFDRIITVNDSVVAGKGYSSNKIMRMLRGAKDSKVILGVQRGNSETLATFELTRGDIPNYSVDVSYKVADGIGYIKVSKFARSTFSEFITAIAKLKQQGVKGFIIDLRDNPGGYLESAVYMVNEFLSKSNLIVYTQGKAYPRSDARANGKGTCQDAPLVVLINEASGSASEIFSGAIQDNDRGLIIGRRSFGKGLVQSKLDLSDKSELVLTIARYYTPSGRCIQKDYELGKAYEYGQDLDNRFIHGEYFSEDSIHQKDSLEFRTVGGRIVYGGGGIMPDIFIPSDTVGVTSYFMKLVNSNVLYQYVLSYSDKHKDKLKSFANYEALYEYLKQQPLVGELEEFAADKGIKKRPVLMEESRKLIERQLYAYIIRNFFDNEGFYPVFLKDDATMQKAIEVITKNIWKPEIFVRYKKENGVKKSESAHISLKGSKTVIYANNS